jgi:hypothetical protein
MKVTRTASAAFTELRGELLGAIAVADVHRHRRARRR